MYDKYVFIRAPKEDIPQLMNLLQGLPHPHPFFFITLPLEDILMNKTDLKSMIERIPD